MRIEPEQLRTRSNATSRRAFTLVEVVLASAILSVVVGGLLSAVMLASRVAETPYKRAPLEMHALLERFRQDAAMATGVTALTTGGLSMTLPDRDNDGNADTVSYDWSQAAATSGIVTRVENGVSESVPVRATSLTLTTDIDQTTTADTTESSEQLLFSRSPALPISYAIKSSQWTGQYVVPSLPGNAVSWRVTRVRFPARYKGPAAGTTRVQIRSQSGGLPRTVIDEATMYEWNLNASYSTQQFSFANAGGLPVNSGICVVLQWASDADAAEVQYESLLALLATGNRVISTNGGTTWFANTLQAMALDVYGTYSVPANVTVKKLRAVNVQMKNDTAMAAPITTSIRFPNLPVVP